MRQHKGLFITFEGGEGSGKTTQGRLLSEWFTQQGIECTLTREPGGAPAAEKIRKLLLDEDLHLDAQTQLLLHCAARADHLNQSILPALRAGQVVICDRFLDSTIAYQHYGDGLNKSLILNIHKILMNNLIPDITFVLDMDLQQYQNRKLVKQNTSDRYEMQPDNYHTKVLEGFRSIAELDPKRCKLIDSNKPIEEIHKLITRHCEGLLKQARCNPSDNSNVCGDDGSEVEQ